MKKILIALYNAIELLEGSENTQLIRAKNRLLDVIAIVKSSDSIPVGQDEVIKTPEVPTTDAQHVDEAPVKKVKKGK